MKTPSIIPLFLAAILLSGSSLLAQNASLEDRLNALEQRVQALAKENTDLKKQLGWKESTPP
ncbi:MAG TPA: hypothetical protein PLG56_09525, partial [Lacunisphaera sp.]|nr:hypothetical protein [Lacunisphaera sp.]